MCEDSLLAGANLLVFSSSVSDTTPLTIARRATDQGIPTVHVLDHWSNYTARLGIDGEKKLHPDLYLVMDQRAAEEAIADGVAAETVVISGGAAFADLELACRSRSARRPPTIAFISEPVERDQGARGSPAFRGYTELDAIASFAECVHRSKRRFAIRVLPHPRQTVVDAMLSWERAAPGLTASPLVEPRGRNILPFVDGIVGMASVLLYEGWLCGLPSLSVQPGAVVNPLAVLEGKIGAFFIKGKDDGAVFARWLSSVDSGRHDAGSVERLSHRNAASRTTDMIEALAAKKVMA